MSIQAIQKFWQKARQDAALLAKLAAIPADDQQAALAALVKVAAEAGFSFTVQEYDAAIKEELTKQHAAGQLSEEQLQEISGGAGAAVFALLSVKPILSGAPCQTPTYYSCAAKACQ